jgi:hypothetical protein
MDSLKSKIRSVPDFPKPGILFYDITTLLRDREGFQETIRALARPFEGKPIDLVIGIESRGFILGGAVADRLGAGFAPVRKKGKLPAATVREDLRSRRAPTAWRFIPTPSSAVSACSSSTMSWRPAGRQPQPRRCSQARRSDLQSLAFSSSWNF